MTSGAAIDRTESQLPRDPYELRLRLDDEAATGNLAAALGRALEPGDVIALEGPLGAGKTALVRALIRACNQADEEVPSPTFTLVQIYDLPKFTLWHFDLYRIGSPDETVELGIDEAFAAGVAIIEWPERLGARLPARALRVRLDFVAGSPEARDVRLSGPETWRDRLIDLDGAFSE